MKTLKPFRYISVSLMTVSLLLFALACGGDDDDDSSGSGGTTTESSGSGGSDTETGSGGTTANESGGTSGGAMDAGQIDGGKPLPENVEEGGECTLDGVFFTAHGTCSSSNDCPGGLPTDFDFSVVSQVVSEFIPSPPNDQANCASGLTCCIKPDQCDVVSESLSTNTILESMLAEVPGTLSVECAAKGSCAATSSDNDFGELPTGCEPGQTCCVNIPKFTPAEGGLPTLDAGTAAADSSAES